MKAKKEIQRLFNDSFGENRYIINSVNTKINDGKKNRYFLEAICKHGTYIKQNMQDAKKGVRPKSCLICCRELDFSSRKKHYEEKRNHSKEGIYNGWADITAIDYDKGYIYFDCSEHNTLNHKQTINNFKKGELPSTCEECKEISYLRKPHTIQFWDHKLRTGNSEIGKKFYIIDEQLFHPKIKRVPLVCTKCNNQKFTVDRTNVGRYASCPKCIKEIQHLNGRSRARSDEEIIKELEYLSKLVPQNYIFLGKEVKKGKDTLIHIGCISEGNIYKTFKRNIYTLHEFMCPYSYPNDSLGERMISKYLKSNNYSFKSKTGFPDCKHINELKFDFVVNLEGYKVFIEFDGSQHFKMPESWGGKDYGKICFQRDQKKNNYVNGKSGYQILRIPYFKVNDIKIILERDFQIINQGESIRYSGDKEVSEFYDSHFKP